MALAICNSDPPPPFMVGKGEAMDIKTKMRKISNEGNLPLRWLS
jgi:hypothetical protein